MRIVSTTCSNTEIVCALGCADMLVGVDDDSDYPVDIVSKLPRVGRDLDVDAVKISVLEPDLVLASLTVPGHEKVLQRLSAAGLQYWASEPVSLSDVYADIVSIAAKLGVPERAQTLITQMQQQMPIQQPVAVAKTVLIQWWPKPVIAPGQLSWAHDLINAAGGHNPLADKKVKSTPLSDQEVVALNPDAIVIAWCGVPFDKYRPEVIYHNSAFVRLQAVQTKQVFCLPEAYLGRPGPRLVEGYAGLKQILQSIS